MAVACGALFGNRAQPTDDNAAAETAPSRATCRNLAPVFGRATGARLRRRRFKGCPLPTLPVTGFFRARRIGAEVTFSAGRRH
jgi:hypothetical protein